MKIRRTLQNRHLAFVVCIVELAWHSLLKAGIPRQFFRSLCLKRIYTPPLDICIWLNPSQRMANNFLCLWVKLLSQCTHLSPKRSKQSTNSDIFRILPIKVNSQKVFCTWTSQVVLCVVSYCLLLFSEIPLIKPFCLPTKQCLLPYPCQTQSHLFCAPARCMFHS